MLYHTGTPSSQFMMVVATNRPMDLDSAVLGLPDTKERERMIQLYFKKYITVPLGITPVTVAVDAPSKDQTSDDASVLLKDCVDLATLAKAAKDMHGFSG